MFKKESYISPYFQQNISYWRESVTKYLFYYLSIVGIIAYIPSIIYAVKIKMWGVVLIDTVVYSLIILITLIKVIHYRIKGFFVIGLCFIMGILLLKLVGPVGAANIWLLAGIIIAGFLFNSKGAVITLVLLLITQIVFYFLIRYRILTWDTIPNYTSEIWLVTCLNFLVINIMVIGAVYLVYHGLYSLFNRIIEIRKSTILGLAKLAEYRDNDTGDHLLRIKVYSTILAKALRKDEKYNKIIDNSFIEDLKLSSILHDIGKVGIKDCILQKKGKLTEEEFDIIKEHTTIGGNVIIEIEKNINGPSFYEFAEDIAFYHHEKWDGTGYPKGKKGEDIPLSARIVSVADVYDALTTRRPYKQAFSHNTAIDFIKDGSGSFFDPDIVKAFLSCNIQFKKYSDKYNKESDKT